MKCHTWGKHDIHLLCSLIYASTPMAKKRLLFLEKIFLETRISRGIWKLTFDIGKLFMFFQLLKREMPGPGNNIQQKKKDDLHTMQSRPFFLIFLVHQTGKFFSRSPFHRGGFLTMTSRFIETEINELTLCSIFIALLTTKIVSAKNPKIVECSELPQQRPSIFLTCNLISPWLLEFT